MPVSAPATMPACASSRTWRATAAILFAFSRASLIAILLLVLLATDPPVTPPVLFRLVAILAVVPGAAAWGIRRALRAEVDIGAAGFIVRRRDLRIEVPYAALERVTPWAVPLAGPGLSLRLRSGRRLGYGIETADLAVLISRLGDAGVEAARSAAAHPTVVFARAKRALRRRRWYHWVGRYPVFALGPTAVLFNAHQHIAHGGTLGEYYLLGLSSYLQTLAVYWSTVSIYLVLYASVWRGLAEGAALGTAWIAPAYAAGVRRAAEIACQVLYYGGVPVLLGLRFLA